MLDIEWKIKTTSVYIQIVDEYDNLICFMGMKDYNYSNAQHIVDMHNNTLKNKKV